MKRITYSDVLSNIDIIKDANLTKKLMSLSHKELSGGVKAVWKYATENPSKVVIAFRENEPIGVVTNTNGNQNIYVKPEYRKMGVASKLKAILKGQQWGNIHWWGLVMSKKMTKIIGYAKGTTATDKNEIIKIIEVSSKIEIKAQTFYDDKTQSVSLIVHYQSPNDTKK